MLEAYYDCRRNKRGKASAVEYEMGYEDKLIALRDRVNARTYRPGRSICFVVKRPRYREVFAASFEDRIIHHHIALRLEPLFEEVFSPRTFNCRKGKGQLYGIGVLREDIRQCSLNYTKDCYVMKLDLKGFFMSIDKAMLAGMVDRFVAERYKGEDIEDLRWLCRLAVLHRPEDDCERHSPMRDWKRLPREKSLFTCGDGKGLAIGNLFVQLFANFLLNPIDWMLDGMGVPFHGRYVDDIYLVHRDKAFLLSCVPVIRERLAALGLSLNERKFYLQHYSKGVEFTGNVLKPGRTYCCNRTVANFVRTVRRLNAADTQETLAWRLSSVNSYLGLMRYTDSYAIRRKVLGMIDRKVFKYAYIKGRFESVALKDRYKERNVTLEKIKNGDFFGGRNAA